MRSEPVWWEREANLPMGRSEEGKSNRARSRKPELKRRRSEKRKNCTTGPPYMYVHTVHVASPRRSDDSAVGSVESVQS